MNKAEDYVFKGIPLLCSRGGRGMVNQMCNWNFSPYQWGGGAGIIFSQFNFLKNFIDDGESP